MPMVAVSPSPGRACGRGAAMAALFWFVVFLAAFLALAWHRVRLGTATGVIAALLLVCTLTSTGLGPGLFLWLLLSLSPPMSSLWVPSLSSVSLLCRCWRPCHFLS